ncbi:MAG: glycosyltransferase, partial [Candidatus Binatia bacterium]
MARRVVVGGAIAHAPIAAAGYTWVFLQWVLGLRRLGCEVLYVEHLEAKDCIDAQWQPAPFAQSENVALFGAVMARCGLTDAAALLERDGAGWVGRSRRDVGAWAAEADLFINLSGRWHLRDVLDAARRRAYVDLDPGFTQIWQAKYGADMNLAGHDAYFTVGLNVGRPDCRIPTLGLEWQPIPPPVAQAEWQPQGPPGAAYTTVADWRGYAPVEWDGVWYKQKSDEFLRLIDLPAHAAAPLEICLAIHPDEPDLPRLRASGWRLSDPARHARTIDTYRDYVRASRGEFSPAKHGYVVGRTGWLSDRTVCYLAAGRPAIVQDTGLSGHLPLGEGLLVFDDAD